MQDLISSIGYCDHIKQDGNKLKKYFLILAKKCNLIKGQSKLI